MKMMMMITAFFLIVVSISPFSAEAYTNYTVGESLGWYDSLENPKINYQNWVSSKPQFTLGDILLFNTDTNHSVVQTYNLTTYENCDYEDSLDTDTLYWSSKVPSNINPTPVLIAVPLDREGMNYFFSSDYDGEQCKNGQRFKINVNHGQGLPPTLSPSDSPDESVSENEDSFPDLSVPDSIFDYPLYPNASTNVDNGSNYNHTSYAIFGPQFNRVLIIFLFICLFLVRN